MCVQLRGSESRCSHTSGALPDQLPSPPPHPPGLSLALSVRRAHSLVYVRSVAADVNLSSHLSSESPAWQPDMRSASDLSGVPGPATAQAPLPSLDSCAALLGLFLLPSSSPPDCVLFESEHGNRQASPKYCSNPVSE